MTAISQFPQPETRKQLQSLFRLIAQFQLWALDTATATCNMRKLLSAKVSYVWTEDCEREFSELKKILCSPLYLQHYDSNLPTTFMADTSPIEGTGFILTQEGKNGKKHIVRCGSVAANKSWRGLSLLESECLRLCWSTQSLDYYLCGCAEVFCMLDHKPLQTLMTAPLETLSPRMLRARLELLPYRIKFVWQPGRCLSICDALGRCPVYQSWRNLPDPLASLTEEAPLNHTILNATCLEDYIGIEVTDKVKEAIRANTGYQ